MESTTTHKHPIVRIYYIYTSNFFQINRSKNPKISHKTDILVIFVRISHKSKYRLSQ